MSPNPLLVQLLKKHSVPSNDILYLEADCNYTFVHTQSGKPILLARTIAHFDLCPQRFLRISRKHVVNASHLLSFDKETVVLINGHTLSISRRKRNVFEKLFLTFKKQ